MAAVIAAGRFRSSGSPRYTGDDPGLLAASSIATAAFRYATPYQKATG
jgi:hypothetical protein